MKPSLWILLTLIAACRLAAPTTFPVGADAGVPDRAAAVCGHLKTLGCPEAEPTPKGLTCVQVYENAPDALDGRCITAAEDVASVRECQVRCGGQTE